MTGQDVHTQQTPTGTEEQGVSNDAVSSLSSLESLYLGENATQRCEKSHVNTEKS